MAVPVKQTSGQGVRTDRHCENSCQHDRARRNSDPKTACLPASRGCNRNRPGPEFRRFDLCGRRLFWLLCFDSLYRRDETISHARHCLDELRIFGVVAENVAELADGCVDAVFGIDENLTGPEVLRDLGASDELVLAGDQQDKELHRLALKTKRVAVAEQLKGSAIEAEITEFVDGAGHGSDRESPGQGKYGTVWQESMRFERGLRFI